MRLIHFTLVLVLAWGGCSAEKRNAIAPSGRIITIEKWHSPEGCAWAVIDRELVVYRMFDYVNRPDELVLRKPISEDDWHRLLSAVAAIPKEVWGNHFDGSCSTHAPLLRISRTKDGSLSSRSTAEAAGFVPDWSRDLIAVLTTIAGQEAPITHQEAVLRYRFRNDPRNEVTRVYKRSIDAQYGVSKSWWEFWK
jgi:hypothetical protein